MTREEYEILLQSDYWKGYSYSLIKERNFTCEDCGRSFPNERNKLQVHHLVYRDVNPWSYKPEELIVLCEDCHKKRHGIYAEPKQSIHADNSPYYSTRMDNRAVMDIDRFEDIVKPSKKNCNKYIIIGGIFILLAIIVGKEIIPKSGLPKEKTEKIDYYYPITKERTPISDKGTSSSKTANTYKKDEQSYISSETGEDINLTNSSKPLQSDDETLKDVEEEYIDNLGEPLQKRYEGKELSSLELLERQQHENVVKDAKRAGVSTEGSTIEILERIQHANVVKDAKRAGVSTEGSTIEILERIQHANVVKDAKRAGVSTEGSTLEILERIQRRNMEKYK